MPSKTRSTLVTAIGELIGDTSNTRWTAAQKQNKIEEWQEKFVIDTKCLKDVQTTTLTVGTGSYDLPSDILDTLRVSHNGLKLERTSAYDLDVLLNSNWSADTGTPLKYYIDLDPDNKKIVVYPIPTDATYSLVIEYLKMPPALSTDASIPFNSHTLLTPYHMAIAYGAAADLLRPEIKMSQNAQAVVEQIKEYERQYSKIMGDCIETFKSMGNQQPLSFGMGRNYRNV